MAIRNSQSPEIDRLMAALVDGTAVERDAAVARLRVIGARGVARLVALAGSDAPADARVAALTALEGSDDPRAREAARRALAAEPAVVVAAVGVLRGWLNADERSEVLEALAVMALDKTAQPAVRLAVLDALSDLPRDLVQPLLQDPPPVAPVPADADAIAMREWVSARGASAPLSELHDIVVRLRERERNEPSARRRQDWLAARAAVHAALAARASRVALYDLRESFDAAARPLPLDFLTSMHKIGDASCLEPLARAWDAAGGETWWRDHLAEAARAIMAREKISRRGALVKRLRAKWPGFV